MSPIRRFFFLFSLLLALVVGPWNFRTSTDQGSGNPIAISFVGFYAPDIAYPSDIHFISADVFHEIAPYDLNGNFWLSFSFSATYVFFNPNTTRTILIALPIDPYLTNMTQTSEITDCFLIYVSEMPVSLMLANASESKELSRLIHLLPTMELSDLLLFNATLPGNAETKIDVICSGFIAFSYVSIFDFEYIVGTANAWSGNVSELVQFITWDYFPEEYYPKDSAIVWEGHKEDRLFGNYSWFFSNQEINIDLVGIRFYHPNYSSNEGNGSLNLETTVILLGFLVLAIPLIWKRRKKL
ncbi:MAG: hypothetical protein ACFFB3_08085 [Candidatus Hodarchaeota archaeon]